jgi:hypothetical protein
LAIRGIACEIPDPGDRLRVNDVIFGELVCGRLEDNSRRYFGGLISKFGRRGCEAVVLGCTEIPLLEVLGIAPTGREVSYAGVALFRVVDNRIAGGWVLGDVHGLVQQLRIGGEASAN